MKLYYLEVLGDVRLLDKFDSFFRKSFYKYFFFTFLSRKKPRARVHKKIHHSNLVHLIDMRFEALDWQD